MVGVRGWEVGDKVCFQIAVMCFRRCLYVTDCCVEVSGRVYRSRGFPRCPQNLYVAEIEMPCVEEEEEEERPCLFAVHTATTATTATTYPTKLYMLELLVLHISTY